MTCHFFVSFLIQKSNAKFSLFRDFLVAYQMLSKINSWVTFYISNILLSSLVITMNYSSKASGLCKDHCHIHFKLSICSSHNYNIHIFKVIHSSLHSFIMNQQNDQLPVGLLAQLVEHCTGIVEVMHSTSILA